MSDQATTSAQSDPTMAERFVRLGAVLCRGTSRPGVGGGVTMVLAPLGGFIWSAVDLVAADGDAMTVLSPVRHGVGEDTVLRCTGGEVGDVAFRVVVTDAGAPDDRGKTVLRLRPTALAQMMSIAV